MKKRAFLGIIIGVVTVIATLVLAGNVFNKTANINSSYDAIKAAHAQNPSNSEISFIFDAINNKITEYPKTVPDFTGLPIESIIDAIGKSERIYIEYTDDDNYENGIIIAQDPAAGAAWSDGVVVGLTVNRKYSSFNDKLGYMSESLGKLYILTSSDNNDMGTIWADGEKLADGEIGRIYADNGNVYYRDSSGIYKLDAEGASQVLGKQTIQHVVNNGKIYYRDIENEENNFYCYNMNDNTNSFVTNVPVLFLYANTDYIVCHSPHDIFILDSENYTILKHIHCEEFITDCSLDNDSIFYTKTKFDHMSTWITTKYNIKQDKQTTVLDLNEPVMVIMSAADDKIILFQYTYESEAGFRYINMRNEEEKFFAIEYNFFEDTIIDIMFDGQKIIYEKDDQTFYSLIIFTGETKKIEVVSQN